MRDEKPTPVSVKELPLCCPAPADIIWNKHPRVYLPIEQTGEAICPYCGKKFVMEREG